MPTTPRYHRTYLVKTSFASIVRRKKSAGEAIHEFLDEAARVTNPPTSFDIVAYVYHGTNKVPKKAMTVTVKDNAIFNVVDHEAQDRAANAERCRPKSKPLEGPAKKEGEPTV